MQERQELLLGCGLQLVIAASVDLESLRSIHNAIIAERWVTMLPPVRTKMASSKFARLAFSRNCGRSWTTAHRIILYRAANVRELSRNWWRCTVRINALFVSALLTRFLSVLLLKPW